MFSFKKIKLPFSAKKKMKDISPEEKNTLFDIQPLLKKLVRLQKLRLSQDKMNKIGIVLGVSVAMAGIAADMAFLGGVGTVTVATCLVADFRNAQQIKKVSKEIEKLDDKLDLLRLEMREEPGFAPALSLLRKTVNDFEAAAKRENKPVQKDLALLRAQVEALADKLEVPVEQQTPAARAARLTNDNLVPKRKPFWGFGRR